MSHLWLSYALLVETDTYSKLVVVFRTLQYAHLKGKLLSRFYSTIHEQDKSSDIEQQPPFGDTMYIIMTWFPCIESSFDEPTDDRNSIPEQQSQFENKTGFYKKNILMSQHLLSACCTIWISTIDFKSF